MSLHYNGVNSYLLMVQKFINLKRKILKFQQVYHIQETLQKSGKQIISKRLDQMHKFMIADYDAITVDDILNIPKYLMKKNNMI